MRHNPNPLYQWLRAHGLTPRDMAKGLQMSYGSTVRYCRPGFLPREEVMMRILNFTGGEVRWDDFLGDRGSYNQIVASEEYRIAQRMIRRKNAEKAKADSSGRKGEKAPRTTA